ncbi:MAG: hypothetical protein ACXV5Q_11095 [Frankiaceae bacterium]
MALLRRTRHAGARSLASGRSGSGGHPASTAGHGAVSGRHDTSGERSSAERHPAGLSERHLRPLSRARTELLQLSSDLLTAILAVEGRTRATLDDLERADALALQVLARQRRRGTPH